MPHTGASDSAATERNDRESDFWGHHLESLEEAIAMYRAGPDNYAQAMLEAIEPIAGARVLDFACGTGVSSAFLAARGAEVTGLDITPESVARARQLCEAVGVRAHFVCGDLTTMHKELPVFDAIVGRCSLHHVDVATFAPLLADRLRTGGTGAFVETLFTNPAFRLARKLFVGRFGIPRFGTLDERPLARKELNLIEQAFGEVRLELVEMAFLRIVDRQLFQYRHPRVTGLAQRADDRLARWRALHGLSYHRLIVVRKV